MVPVCRRKLLCGRRGNRKHRPPFCVAGVALGDINLPFVWQAWHLHASTSILCGRRGTWRHQPSRCVAGVAFMAPWLFVCLAWPSEASNLILWERRGTWRHRLSLCLAGVAFVALGWLWWHAWFPFVATALCVAIWKHPPPFCLAGMWGWVNIPRVYIISPSGFMDSLAYSMLYKYSYLNHEYISIEHYRTNNQIKYPFNHSLYTTYGVYIYIFIHTHIYIYIYLFRFKSIKNKVGKLGNTTFKQEFMEMVVLHT